MSRKWDCKVDENQPEIVEGLRAAHFSVLPIHRLGQGCPDILVGGPAGNVLLELKDGEKAPSQRKLTEAESAFFSTWKGPLACVCDLDEALAISIRYCGTPI